ncbi:unnamed protein product [Protopolystoma xenopodis]|uniref:Uncharacterized protein n=1 Tax=Protopolystoma xenopodis TaxID=117903 RepID=A0A3S5BGW1_9PLAT|nr:unnamed protein product [Protopolystoma xenopodis]
MDSHFCCPGRVEDTSDCSLPGNMTLTCTAVASNSPGNHDSLHLGRQAATAATAADSTKAFVVKREDEEWEREIDGEKPEIRQTQLNETKLREDQAKTTSSGTIQSQQDLRQTDWMVKQAADLSWGEKVGY